MFMRVKCWYERPTGFLRMAYLDLEGWRTAGRLEAAERIIKHIFQKNTDSIQAAR
jgi:hypothetical protein